MPQYIYAEPNNPPEFNKAYYGTVDSMTSGIVLNFNKSGFYKRLDQLCIGGYGFIGAALNEQFLQSYVIVKGTQAITTAIISSVPLTYGPGAYQGVPIAYGFVNLAEGNSMVHFTPSLVIEPEESLSIAFLGCFNAVTQVRQNVILAVTAFGRYIPKQNANLTEQSYLNSQAFQV